MQPSHPIIKVSPMSEPWTKRITVISGLCGGRPTIRGMRIRVVDVLEMLAGGMTSPEILNDFPYLEAEDIHACLEFAAAQANGTWHPVPQVA
jgi:uncharacterized protein (DUF433 family)